MTRTRLEEFLGNLNYGLLKFAKKNKCANDADIFTFVENTVKEAVNYRQLKQAVFQRAKETQVLTRGFNA